MSFNAQAYGGGTFGSHLFSFVLLTTKYSRYDTTASSGNRPSKERFSPPPPTHTGGDQNLFWAIKTEENASSHHTP